MATDKHLLTAAGDVVAYTAESVGYFLTLVYTSYVLLFHCATHATHDNAVLSVVILSVRLSVCHCHMRAL